VYCDIDNDGLAAQMRIVPDPVNQTPQLLATHASPQASTFEVVGK